MTDTRTEARPRDPYIDLTDPSFARDPYALYRAAYAEGAVYFSKAQGCWFLLGYDEVQQGLRDRRLGPLGNTVAAQTMAHKPAADSNFLAMYQRWILTRDDAAHTRLRVLMTKAFTPKAVNAFLPRIHGIVGDLLAPALARGSMEFMGEFAYQLPMIAISELIGIPRGDLERMSQWVISILPMLEVVKTPAQEAAGELALGEVRAYLGNLVSERRKSPEGRLLDALIAAEEAGDRLTTDELVANVLLLFAAGYETTANLLGNGLYALLKNPEQLALLKRDPTLIENAVEEFLRFDSPVQMLRRGTYEDVVYGEKTIQKGSVVVLCVAGANRDPRRFPKPDQLDVTRPDIRPLSFGNGMHACLGAHLARSEARLAFEQVLSAMPAIALAEEPERRPLLSLRGVDALRITF